MSNVKYPVIKGQYWRLELYPTKDQLDRDGLAKAYNGASGYGTLPDNWRDILDGTLIPYALSPLHDKDTNSDGTIKKPHYHVLLTYPTSNTTLKAVAQRIAEPLNAPRPIIADVPKQAYEYLWHKNHPEKYQYNQSDVEHHNGFSPDINLPLSKDEVTRCKWALVCRILEEDISEYCDFINFVGSEYGDTSDEFAVASGNTVFFNAYLTSKRNKERQQNNSDSEEVGQEVKQKNENCSGE